MLEQLDEVNEELGELKASLEYKQESLFGNKVNQDPEYQKDLRILDRDQEDETSGFMMEFSAILEGMKESVFVEANEDNEELVIANTRESLISLEREIANS